MSRFVRASKYRHVFGQPSKKEYMLENVKVSNSAWDTNYISASAKYISVNWNSSGGGSFAILPLPSPFHGINDFPHKIPDSLPLARSHTAAVLDTDWCPHNDSIVASGAEDGKVMIWKVEASAFEGWSQEGWEPKDFDPVLRIDASARKIGQVLFHPTAANVVASAAGDHTVKLWDLANPEEPRVVFGPHGDAIQGLTFNPTGTVLATTSRDKKIRLFDARKGPDPVRVTDGHAGIKGSRIVWLGDLDRIATTGFSRMSDRQLNLWETGGLGSIKSINVDQSSGVLMPFWTDNHILFLAGKGDGNIRYYEYESDALYPLAEHKSSDPQRGMCFLPRRSLSVADCEIARAYKIHGSIVEPIAFIVPRKADSFQSDIFPPALSAESSLSASEFFNGKVAPPKLVDLSTGVTFSGAISSPAVSSPPPSAAPAPTRTFTAAAPVPAPAQIPVASPPAAVPVVRPPILRELSPSPPSSATLPKQAESPLRSASVDDDLKSENARLTAELREARQKIRNLELQVETLRANARKAAQALLDEQ